MWLDQVLNPGPLTCESGALPTALCGPAHVEDASYLEGAQCCGYCPCTCTLIKNPVMMTKRRKNFLKISTGKSHIHINESTNIFLWNLHHFNFEGILTSSYVIF